MGCFSYTRILWGPSPTDQRRPPSISSETVTQIRCDDRLTLEFTSSRTKQHSFHGSLMYLNRCVNKRQRRSGEECWMWGGGPEECRKLQSTPPFPYILVKFVGRLLPFPGEKLPVKQDCLLSLQGNCVDPFMPFRSLEKYFLGILMNGP